MGGGNTVGDFVIYFDACVTRSLLDSRQIFIHQIPIFRCTRIRYIFGHKYLQRNKRTPHRDRRCWDDLDVHVTTEGVNVNICNPPKLVVVAFPVYVFCEVGLR